MIYPCERCIVDVICIDPCTDLIFFSDELKNSNMLLDFVKTTPRKDRLEFCILKYASGGANRKVKLHSRLAELWNAHYPKIYPLKECHD